MCFNILFLSCLMAWLSWSTDYSASYESSLADDAQHELDAQVKGLKDLNIKLIDDKWLDITITERNKEEIADFFSEQEDLLNLYDPIVTIECAIDDALVSLLISWPKLWGLRLKRATPLSINEAELLDRVIGEFPQTLRELSFSGTHEWVRAYPRDNGKYPKHNPTLNTSELIDQETIVPILLALKAITRLERLTLSAIGPFQSNHPARSEDQEQQFWQDIGQMTSLKFLDISHFTGSKFFNDMSHHLAKIDQLEEVRIGGSRWQPIVFLGEDNFAQLKILQINHWVKEQTIQQALQNKPALEELEIFVSLQSKGKGYLDGEFLQTLEDAPLKKLSIINQMVISEHLEAMHFMNLTNTLTSLNLSYNKIDNEALRHIIPALEAIEFLDLSYNQLTERGFKFSHKFTQSLVMFRVKGNQLDYQERFRILENFAHSHPTCEVVIFNTEQMKDDVVRFIVLGHMDGQVVDATDLPDDKLIGDAGARLMIPQVLSNDDLVELRLEKLSSEGLMPLLEALHHAPNLAVLVLKGNNGKYMYDVKLQPFAQLNLATLRFIDDAFINDFVCGINMLPESLTELELSHNHWQRENSGYLWQQLNRILPSLPNLKVLNLSHNDLSAYKHDRYNQTTSKYIPNGKCPSAKLVRKILKSDQHQIEELDLSNNDLREYVSKFLKKGHPDCSLRKVNVSKNMVRNTYPLNSSLCGYLQGFLDQEDHYITHLIIEEYIPGVYANHKKNSNSKLDFSKAPQLECLEIVDSGLGFFSGNYLSYRHKYLHGVGDVWNFFKDALEAAHINTLIFTCTSKLDEMMKPGDYHFPDYPTRVKIINTNKKLPPNIRDFIVNADE